MANSQSRLSEEIKLEGHIIDSLILPRVMDVIMDAGGNFDVLEVDVGTHKHAISLARMKVFAETQEQMDHIITALQELGAQLVNSDDVAVAPAPAAGALPDAFYSTTNLPTEVRLNGRWQPVEGTEMDLVVVVEPDQGRARNVPISEIKQGDLVVIGHSGIRVLPPQRQREQEVFSFMRNEVSSERPNKLAIAQIARTMRQVREAGQRICFVIGPAIIHSGAGPYMERLIRSGYVQVLFGGNAIAVHDVESQLFGTSLGINLTNGLPVPGGHSHHMRAINAMRRIGSIKRAVEIGFLRSGLMAEAYRSGIDMVLAGSVRDDGPMPDVIGDMSEAQRQMRAALQGVDMCIMLATMLHSIATGNLLASHVKVVAVDINPATVTKLADRGSFQAVGIVTDAELFLRELVEELDLPE
ncbi:TIGR00300 family protein [Candidatus Amarolinea aalborgensis]|uniref:ornithine cyclodeaminase n=1 Tax=Candidatus Amarolinea aalborgensis TaxID=2249329 RepID=UPI003BF98D96